MEIDLLKMLQHKNIVHYIEHVCTDLQLSIIMECVVLPYFLSRSLFPLIGAAPSLTSCANACSLGMLRAEVWSRSCASTDAFPNRFVLFLCDGALLSAAHL